MTQTSNSTKTAAEAHVSGPRDDDIKQRMREVELALEVLVDVEADHEWLRPNDLCRDARRKDWCRDARTKEVKANLQHISKLCRDGEAYRAERQNGAPRKPSKPPTLASVAKQASKAALDVARYEMKPDGTIVVVAGKPAPVEPENPWPLDEFRTKETKQ